MLSSIARNGMRKGGSKDLNRPIANGSGISSVYAGAPKILEYKPGLSRRILKNLGFLVLKNL